jgi:membrane-bound hydrogenase subunit beta
MTPEQRIEQELAKTFPFLQGKIVVARARRIFVDVPAAQFRKVFEYLVGEAGFTILCTITGLDQGATLGVLYHLAQEGGIVLTAATAVPKEAPVIQSVTSTFPAADAYEREMVDLLGMQVEGLGPGSRYPLPDDWPAGEYPLRKDWKGLPETNKPAERKESADA